MALKDNIKSKRLEAGMTLEELAQKVGVSRQTIQRYESGVISNIPSDNIEKIAAALYVTPACLMGWVHCEEEPHNMQKAVNRIKQQRLQLGLSYEDLAELTKISKSTLQRYESGSAKDMSFDKLKILARALQVTTSYLMGIEDVSQFLDEVPMSLAKRIPIMGTVKCGPNGLAFEDISGYISVDSSLTGDIRAFRCAGESMVGMGIFAGDIAVVRRQDTVENGELAIVVINGEEGALKKVHKQENALVLESANPEYQPRIFIGPDMNTVKIAGKVLQVIKQF